MKRQLSLVLALVMILGSFSSVFAAVPTTIDGKAAFLAEAGILKGNQSGDLKLKDDLKRRDAVVVLSRLFDVEDKAKVYPSESLVFTDMTDAFYAGFVAWAVEEGYAKGKTETTFGPNDPLTAKHLSTFLLRALKYDVDTTEAYDKALETAKELGIFADLDVVGNVTRGDMAAMTFNALGVKVKGTEKTLAETLEIKMPTPDEATELTGKVNDTENLREVVLELSNAKLADAKKLQDKNNYRVEKFKVEKVTVEGNNVVILLTDALIKNKSYDLVVRNIEKEINKSYTFKALDNASPVIEKVETLGEYGIKITASEPVIRPEERNFLVDGKNIAMVVEQYGRVIVLTPYHKASFPTDAKTLTVKGLQDYAGYKSALEEFEINVVKDEEAPKVLEATVDGATVEVTFDKDIYEDSVTGYVNRKTEGNIFYKEGRQDIFTKQEEKIEGVTHNYGEKIDTNKVVYSFKNTIPKGTEVTIVGVQNHSKVEMEKTVIDLTEMKNNLEPIIIDKDISTKPVADGKSTATIVLEFDKAVQNNFTIANNLSLYTEKVLDRYEEAGKIVSLEYDGTKRDTVVVKLEIECTETM